MAFLYSTNGLRQGVELSLDNTKQKDHVGNYQKINLRRQAAARFQNTARKFCIRMGYAPNHLPDKFQMLVSTYNPHQNTRLFLTFLGDSELPIPSDQNTPTLDAHVTPLLNLLQRFLKHQVLSESFPDNPFTISTSSSAASSA